MRLILIVSLIVWGLGGLPSPAAAAGSERDDALASCKTVRGTERIEACSRFIALEKSDKDNLSTAHFYRGEAYSKAKEHEKAIADFTRSNEYFEHPTNRYKRGNEYLSLKQYENAIAEYSYVVKRLPNHSGAFNNRGTARWRLGQLDEAIADYSLAIERDPAHAMGYYNRARAYLAHGKPALGLPDIDKLVKAHPRAANVWFTRAQLLEALDRDEDAADAYRRTLKLEPSRQSAKDALKRLGAAQ